MNIENLPSILHSRRMVQTHRAVGYVAAGEVRQVMVTHGDGDGKEPFVGVGDQRGVAGRVLCRDR